MDFTILFLLWRTWVKFRLDYWDVVEAVPEMGTGRDRSTPFTLLTPECCICIHSYTYHTLSLSPPFFIFQVYVLVCLPVFFWERIFFISFYFSIIFVSVHRLLLFFLPSSFYLVLFHVLALRWICCTFVSALCWFPRLLWLAFPFGFSLLFFFFFFFFFILRALLLFILTRDRIPLGLNL